MILRVLGAVCLIGALLAVPSTAHADPIPACHDIGCLIKPGGSGPLAGDSLFCPSSKTSQVPAVRFSGAAPGFSSNFDGTPSDTGGAAGTTIYQTRGAHPLSFTMYDEGCLGAASQVVNGNGTDTLIGNILLGAATDLAAVANATHRYATHPALWMAPVDRLETNAVNAVTAGVWNIFIGISLLILALVIWTRHHRGDLSGTMHQAGWAFAVFALVVVVMASPLRVTHAVASGETQMINTVDSAMAGDQGANPSSSGDLAMDNILYPAWLAGEFGSSDSPIAQKYGPQLLDATSMTWAEAAQPDRAAIEKAKHDEFMKVATAIHDADPDAYGNLKGQSGGRIGTGTWALLGMAFTVPLRILADLMAMGALILLAVTAVFLPIIGLLGIHSAFEPMFRRVIDVVIASLVAAVTFSGAASLQLVATGFLIGPQAQIPLWAGLGISALLAVFMVLLLRPIHRFVSMAPQAVRRGVRDRLLTAGAIAGPALAYASYRNSNRTRRDVEDFVERPERIREEERSPAPSAVPRPERVTAEWADWPATSPNGNGKHRNGNGSTLVDDPPITTTSRDRPPVLDEGYDEPPGSYEGPVRRELPQILPPEPEEEAS